MAINRKVNTLDRHMRRPSHVDGGSSVGRRKPPSRRMSSFSSMIMATGLRVLRFGDCPQEKFDISVLFLPTKVSRYLAVFSLFLTLASFSWARFTIKVKLIIISLNFRSSQLARISLAEFVSKLILI